jgi:hypothetical protein
MRMTGKLKMEILANVSDGAFSAERDELAKKALAVSESIYRAFVSPALEQLVRKAGADFVFMNNRQDFLIFQSDDDRHAFNRAVDFQAVFAAQMPIRLNWRSSKPALVSPRIYMTAQSVLDEGARLSTKIKDLKEGVRRVLATINTTEDLVKQLPSISVFVPTTARENPQFKAVSEGEIEAISTLLKRATTR